MERSMGRSWILWPFFFLGGWMIFGDHLWQLPLWTAGALVINSVIRSRTPEHFAPSIVGWTGLIVLTLASLLVLLGTVWITQTGQFTSGNPAWLGNQDLVIPAILFWGFPWVGTVGVLIYLSGLQNIPTDVYEAAALDGVSPFKMLFLIELPLIMTQVRINLIFMTIGTLTTYEMFLLLLGPDGGPGNKGMVPGLYIFSSAFTEGKFGYGCALGMVLFVIIMTLTIIYQKYVKVDK
jgi:ABC-type sugar transport system permease subunit